jgi:hypothetical protein
MEQLFIQALKLAPHERARLIKLLVEALLPVAAIP